MCRGLQLYRTVAYGWWTPIHRATGRVVPDGGRSSSRDGRGGKVNQREKILPQLSGPRHACSFKWDGAARMQLISKPVQSFTLRTPVHLPRSPVLAMAPLWISPTETASCTGKKACSLDLPGLMRFWQQWSDASERVEGEEAAVLRTRPSRMPPPSGAKLLGQPDPLTSSSKW